MSRLNSMVAGRGTSGAAWALQIDRNKVPSTAREQFGISMTGHLLARSHGVYTPLDHGPSSLAHSIQYKGLLGHADIAICSLRERRLDRLSSAGSEDNLQSTWHI